MPNPVIPSNIEAEVALLGCVFIDGELIISIADQLRPDDFYDSKNRILFKTILQMREEGKSIDITSVASELTNLDLLASVGGIEYLSSLANFSYSTINVDTYISIIIDSALKRQTINELSRLAQKGYEGDLKAFDYIESVEQSVFELSKRRRVDDFRHIKGVAKNVLETTANAAKNDEEIVGLDTGFRSLNRFTLGFQPGQLIILAARPSMGKSAFAMNLAVNIANHNRGGHASVAIFSLEMAAEQLTERMIACDASLKLNYIKNGRFPSPDDWRRFESSSAKLGDMNLYFEDSASVKVSDIRAKCRKLSSDHGLDFVVIDYLQLIAAEVESKSQQEDISKISRSLKLMARELNVPVLALSQLSRAVEKRDDKKPIMADLRDSGSIEQDADIVMFLYRDEYYTHKADSKGEAQLIISKNRSGATSEGLDFRFQGEYARFTERVNHEEQEENE